jgi:hypothetical protein
MTGLESLSQLREQLTTANAELEAYRLSNASLVRVAVTARQRVAKVEGVLEHYDEHGYDEDLDPMMVIDKFREALK